MKSERHSIRRTQKKLRALYLWLSRIFVILGACMLAYAAYFYASAFAFQKIETISLTYPKTPAAPEIRRYVPEGDVVGRIEVGRLGLSVIVVQGDSWSLLRRGVGHLPETPLPGESGNIAVAGHRDTFFRLLRNIHEGDVIAFDTTRGEYHYTVESISIVPPTATEVLQPSENEELTLITCYPFYYFGPAPDRFIVRARRTSAPDNWQTP